MNEEKFSKDSSLSSSFVVGARVTYQHRPTSQEYSLAIEKRSLRKLSSVRISKSLFSSHQPTFTFLHHTQRMSYGGGGGYGQPQQQSRSKVVFGKSAASFPFFDLLIKVGIQLVISHSTTLRNNS